LNFSFLFLKVNVFFSDTDTRDQITEAAGRGLLVGLIVGAIVCCICIMCFTYGYYYYYSNNVFLLLFSPISTASFKENAMPIQGHGGIIRQIQVM
jgi:hypothetical protein